MSHGDAPQLSIMFRRSNPQNAWAEASMSIIANGSNGSVRPTTRAEFEAVFPSLVEDLAQHCKQYNSPENALKWFQDVSRRLRRSLPSRKTHTFAVTKAQYHGRQVQSRNVGSRHGIDPSITCSTSR